MSDEYLEVNIASCKLLFAKENPIRGKDIVWFQAICESTDVYIRATSACYVGDLEFFSTKLQKLYDQLNEEVSLTTLDDNFKLNLKADKLGHIEMNVKISPDPEYQSHELRYEIDQTYLPDAISKFKIIARHCDEIKEKRKKSH